ncbi:MAG: hypothetical protein R2688_07525 [Fimbriimonadaceae bacterium]
MAAVNLNIWWRGKHISGQPDEDHQFDCGSDSKKFETVNVEQLLQWNPDIILTTEEGAKAIGADARLKSLNAVRDLYVFGTDPDILLRAGVRVDDLLENFVPMADRIWSSRKGTTH